MANRTDALIAELAARYRGLAAEILAEIIRIPADHVDKSSDQGGDPACGLSNHEGPRLAYLKRRIIEIGAVRHPNDVGFDAFGNLVWTLSDPDDGIAPAQKKVIYFDGHTDTVKALRPQWKAKTDGGLDPYDGAVDPSRVDRDWLRGELGYLPPEDEWDNLLFGRGAADQLGGVVAQVVASKILLEVPGALRGAIIWSYATVAEEDNDGGGPMFITNSVLPGAGPERYPDVVILTEGTGDAQKGALGIYRGQRGRMQIEVAVTGRSCHGSMPWEGLNPLEYGAAILVEATAQHMAGDGFKDHAFLGKGTRTASWATLDSPSDCAVPERFTFRFDRRLTAGEDAFEAVAAIEALPAVARARAAGLKVQVQAPTYTDPTWTGFVPGNPAIYPGWETPEDHPAIQAAVATYRAVVTPNVGKSADRGAGSLRSEPRVDRWIFSTDGVGFPVRRGSLPVPKQKAWVDGGAVEHPPMFGLGPGIEQNTHKIGEVCDTRELQHAIAFLVRYPATLVGA